MKKNKTVIKILLVLPLVVGLVFTGQSQVLAQSASLVATVRVNPLKVEVTTTSPVSVGQRFKVQAIINNLGQTRIKQAKAEIFLPPGLSFKGNSEQNLGVILPNNSKTASWQIIAETPGDYFILVYASGIEEETGGLVKAEGTTPVIVTNSLSFWGRIRRLLARAASFKVGITVS